MGAGSSRDAAGSRKARSCSGSRRGKGKPSVKDRFLGSACLRSRQVFSDEENEGNGSRMKIKPCTVELGQSSLNHPGGVKHPQVNLALTNITRLGEDNGENTSPMELVSDRSSASGSAKTSKSSVRFRSRFSLFHKGSVFRVNSSASGGSSGTRPIFSRSFSTPCAEEVNHANMIEDVTSNNSYDPHQQSITDAASSASPVVSNTNPIDGVGHYSQMNPALSEILGVGNSQRQSQEPSEGTARFSRSRSVGRLRDRVLHRSLLSEEGSTVITSADEAHVHQGSRMQQLSGAENVSSINENAGTPISSINHLSSMSRSIENNHNPDSEATTSRDSETLEYRLDFLERRRRIRSQVRALQRLSMRFESLSGHERSCILSGQHRSGCCSCRTPGRSVNPGEDTSTRASVSRIVMLAEALFEVLDEIHQQAVVLASRPSLSSIGAVPAPKEVVDCMPVKLFAMSRKCPSDDAAQCYICLVEYEEGDSIRILPCCHEFHQACVDKWLKEVHRVCPLCRGDVCISEVTRAEGHESSSS